MEIKIMKLQGAGNDFIMLDNRGLRLSPAQKLAFVKKFSLPRVAIGADGVMFLEDDAECDLAWDFYNSDGSRAEMCGNGARCFTVFATAIGAAVSPFTFKTLAGAIRAELTQAPDIDGAARAKVQLTPAGNFQIFPGLEAAGRTFTGYFINTGVPHLVVILDDPADFAVLDIMTFGRALRNHPQFAPAGTNVNFITIDPDGVIAVRTYERGVEAETLACGTGSVASAIVAGETRSLAGSKHIRTRGGDWLNIDYRKGTDGYEAIFLEGPAVRVFVGEVTFNP